MLHGCGACPAVPVDLEGAHRHEQSSGPRMIGVAGNWRGSWRGAAASRHTGRVDGGDRRIERESQGSSFKRAAGPRGEAMRRGPGARPCGVAMRRHAHQDHVTLAQYIFFKVRDNGMVLFPRSYTDHRIKSPAHECRMRPPNERCAM
jgi:hypothetical protein